MKICQTRWIKLFKIYSERYKLQMNEIDHPENWERSEYNILCLSRSLSLFEKMTTTTTTTTSSNAVRNRISEALLKSQNEKINKQE